MRREIRAPLAHSNLFRHAIGEAVCTHQVTFRVSMKNSAYLRGRFAIECENIIPV